ncbi:MAG: redox-sensing transcriptional repressor Rex, partial [Actinobacteria bacterium]
MARTDAGRPSTPEATVRRLPVYLRCLLELENAGTAVVSSERLADLAGTNAAQVRKDLSVLGEGGVRGMGYDVAGLATRLRQHLGLDRGRRVAIVGFGRIGSALLGYPGFAARGFDVVAVLDSDPAKIG